MKIIDDSGWMDASGTMRKSANDLFLVLNIFIERQEKIQISEKEVTKALQGVVNNHSRFNGRNIKKFF